MRPRQASYGDAGPCLRPHCPGARGQCKGFNMHKVAYVDAAKHGTASGSTAVGTPGGEGCGTVATPKSFCSLMKRPRAQPTYSLRGRGAVRPDEIEHCKDFLALLRVAHLLPAPCALSTMMPLPPRTAAAWMRVADTGACISGQRLRTNRAACGAVQGIFGRGTPGGAQRRPTPACIECAAARAAAPTAPGPASPTPLPRSAFCPPCRRRRPACRLS